MDYRSFEVTENSVVGRFDDELTLRGVLDHRDGNMSVWLLIYEFRGTPIGQTRVRVSWKFAAMEISNIFIRTAPSWRAKADRMASKTLVIKAIRHTQGIL